MKKQDMAGTAYNNAPEQTNLQGEIDGLFGQGVCGWVWHPELPQQRLWVEAIVDGCSMGVARAESYHPGAAACGDGCYGFWIALPAFVRNEAHHLQVQVANSAATFAAPLYLKSEKPSDADKKKPSLSRVYSDGGLRLSGWALDPVASGRTVRVSVKHNGKRITSVAADKRRFDPSISDGHGFDITLPLEFADGDAHYITVSDDHEKPLSGSPVWVHTLSHNVSDWLEHEDITPKNKTLLHAMLQHYEQWLPRSIWFSLYPQWSMCFPVSTNATADSDVPVCSANSTYAELRRIATGHEGVVLCASASALYPQAQQLFCECSRTSGVVLVYADADSHPEQTHVANPRFKPAWDAFLFAGTDYLDSIFIRTDFLTSLDFPEDIHSLELRTRLILAAAGQEGIAHIPEVLSRVKEQLYTPQEHSRRCELLTQWYAHAGTDAQIVPHPGSGCASCNQISYRLREKRRVSIIIPTRDRADLLKVCLESLWYKTTYEDVEIIIIDNGSCESKTMELFGQAQHKGVRVLEYAHPFNYSAMNNMAARQARGEVLCFLNNDTEVITPDWLEHMLSILEQPNVGCVGAKLLWPNDLIQHGGVVVGPHQLAAHVGNQWHAEAPGYMCRAQLVQQWSAVTAACLLTPRRLFLDTGSFDGITFPVAFNDVDYCLRLRHMGKQVVWTPQARLYHHESASRGTDTRKHDQARNRMEVVNFRDKWGQYTDPFYNPNLTLSTVSEPFNGLALPPRNRKCRQ